MAVLDAPAARRRDLPPLEERATYLVHRFNARLPQACLPVFAAYEPGLHSLRILVAPTRHGMLSVGALVELRLTSLVPQATEGCNRIGSPLMMMYVNLPTLSERRP